MGGSTLDGDDKEHSLVNEGDTVSKWSQVNKGVFVLANSATSLAEATLLYPFELIKTREQIGSQGMRTIVTNVWRQGGLLGFYRGFLWNAMGGLPSEVLFWVSYNVVKDELSQQHPDMPEVAVYLCAGAVADAMSCSIWVPMDIVCQRMQADSLYAPPAEYQGLKFKGFKKKGSDVIRHIAAKDGPRGFWRGMGVTLAIHVPGSAAQMAMYEFMKCRFMKAWKLPEDHGVIHVAAGGVAGMTTAIVTNPLDVVKTRLQVDAEAKTGRRVLQELLQAYGYQGLFRGIGPRVLSFAPRSSLSFVLYEAAIKVATL